jgi:hypothetical protein
MRFRDGKEACPKITKAKKEKVDN